MKKIYCDKCGNECRAGNDVSITSLNTEGFRVSVTIRTRYSDGPADLCQQCARTIVGDGIREFDRIREYLNNQQQQEK